MTELTGKQRAKLRALANRLEVILHIGKEGLTENILKQADMLLENRELIKIAILQNAGEEAKNLIGICCEKLGASPVQFIGGRFIIYRRSNKPDIEHIEI